jgi:hypothetical protein
LFFCKFVKIKNMSHAELQTDIIQLILETKNPAILEKIADYVRSLRKREDWWEEFSENEKNFIQRSASQIDEGKVVPNEAVKTEIRERLKKA